MKPPKPSEIDSFREDLLSWSESNLREYPWRKSDDSYRVLVAEILLQKTFADKVEPIYDEFVDRYPRLDALTEAKVEAVTSLLKPLGLQNVRAKALIDIANEYADGGIPDDKEALLELPYVGPYAANATLCFAFDERRPIVDANVVRVFNRAFGLDLTPQDKGVGNRRSSPAGSRLSEVQLGSRRFRGEDLYCRFAPVSRLLL